MSDLHDIKSIENRGNKNQKNTNGGDVANHHRKQLLALEFAADRHLVDNGLGLQEIANQQAGGEGHDGHQNAVADKVKEIKELHAERSDLAPDAGAESGGDAKEQADAKHHEAAYLAPQLQLVLENRYDSLHQRDGGGQCRKKNHDKERRAKEGAAGDGFKDLGQGDEHKSGAFIEGALIATREGEDGGNDHQTRQKSDGGVENFDLPCTALDADVLFHIGTKGDHDAHGEGHGVEKLSHGGDHRHDREFGEVGLDIVDHAFPSTVHGADGVNGDAEDENDEDGHHDLADLFHALFYTEKHDQCGNADEQREPEERLARLTDIVVEIIALCHLARVAQNKARKVLHDPAADDRVVGKNDNRNHRAKGPDKGKAFVKRAERTDGAELCFSADGDLGDHQGKAEGDGKSDVHQQKDAATVLCRKVGESPNVAQAHRRACCCKNKTDLAGKGTSFGTHFDTPDFFAIP